MQPASSERDAVSWPHLMRFGFGALNLSPHAFWALTLPELRAAIEWHFGASAEAPDRTWLDDAIRAHPDAPIGRESNRDERL